MTDGQGVLVSEPRIKLVIGLVTLLGLGWAIATYFNKQENRITNLETNYVKLEARFDANTKRQDQKIEEVSDSIRMVDRNVILLDAWIKNRYGGK